MSHPIRIWDLPTRLFHWLLALCVLGLVITANVGGNAMQWHFRLGYAVATLLLFRLVWGLVGGHWSRFTSFMYAPASLLRYLRGHSPEAHRLGHNPLGALSVWALLLFLLAQVGSGLFSDDEIAAAGPLTALVSGDTVALASWYHKDIGALVLIALAALHVMAVLFYTFVKKQSLVPAMLHGHKHSQDSSLPSARDSLGSRVLALLVLLGCAALVRWVVLLGG